MAQFFTPYTPAMSRAADAFVQADETRNRNRLATLQEEAALMQVEEARTAAADRTRLRNRLSDLRGGYTYPEPGGVGPMPPGQESSLSQLMPVQQPASQSQIMDVYRQEAMQGNQFAAQSLPGMINLDNALAEYGARVKAGGGDINAYYEQQMEVEMAKRAADTIKPYLKDPEALKALWPRFQQMFPMLQNATPDQFVSDGGDGVIYAAKTPDGQLVPNVYVSYDENGKPSVHTVIDREGLADKRFQQQMELQDRRLAQQMELQGRREAAAESRMMRQIDASDRRALLRDEKAKQGRPLPAGQLESISDMKKVADVLREAQGVANKVDTGPVAGRLQSLGSKVGLSSDTFADFEQKLATAQNIMLKLRSGAAVTDQEYSRFLREYPTPNDPPAVRDRKLRNTINYATNLMNEKLDIYEEGGYKVPRQAAGRTGTPAARTPAPSRGARPGDDFLRKKGLK